jgi:hypothetical protein
MSRTSVSRKSSVGQNRTSSKQGLRIRYQDVVASLSLAVLSSTVLALVFESMI